MTNTIHFDSVSHDAPDLRALTTSACLTRPPGTGRTVTSVTKPLPVRPKLWTTFQRLELSGNGVPCTTRSRSWNARNNSIFQVIHRHLENGSPPEIRTTCCPGIRKGSLNDGMAYSHSIGEVRPERVGPERDAPEGDGPEREDPARGDQLERAGDQLVRVERYPASEKPAEDEPERVDQLIRVEKYQLVMSLDEKGSRSPPRVVKPQKYPAKDDQFERTGEQLVRVKIYPASEKPAEDEPERVEQLLRVEKHQLVMSLDEKGSRSPPRVVKPQKYPMETWNMYYKSIALKVPELHVSPHKMAAFKVPGGSTRSKGTTCPIQRGNKIIIRIILIKKPTQVDKYLRTLRTRRIYTRTVLVTITQNVPDKRTRRSKNHFVSISVSSSLTKVTLECPVLSRGSGLDNNRGRFLFNHYQKWICRVQVSVKSRSRYRRRARF